MMNLRQPNPEEPKESSDESQEGIVGIGTSIINNARIHFQEAYAREQDPDSREIYVARPLNASDLKEEAVGVLLTRDGKALQYGDRNREQLWLIGQPRSDTHPVIAPDAPLIWIDYKSEGRNIMLHVDKDGVFVEKRNVNLTDLVRRIFSFAGISAAEVDEVREISQAPTLTPKLPHGLTPEVVNDKVREFFLTPLAYRKPVSS